MKSNTIERAISICYGITIICASFLASLIVYLYSSDKVIFWKNTFVAGRNTYTVITDGRFELFPKQAFANCTKSVCSCKNSYISLTCELYYKCVAETCKFQGTCTQHRQIISDIYCHCKPGFTGKLCQTNINECSSSPCKHNGSCIDKIFAFVCKCQYGWIGKTCQKDADLCLPNPCKLGGKCIDKLTFYFCICKKGSFGRHCERKEPCFIDRQIGPVIERFSLRTNVIYYRVFVQHNWLIVAYRKKSKCFFGLYEKDPWETIQYIRSIHIDNVEYYCPKIINLVFSYPRFMAFITKRNIWICKIKQGRKKARQCHKETIVDKARNKTLSLRNIYLLSNKVA